MGERSRNEKNFVADRMLKIYGISDEEKGLFYLQVDWLLENAVYPSESGYAENLSDLWNVYMPSYHFDKIVLEYSKKYHPVLRYVHDGEIQKFNSVKYMQDTAVKNYIKTRISQGITNRMVLVKECFEIFKDISDRTKLYDVINKCLEIYFVNGELEQQSISFLKRFQDSDIQPYSEIVERLSDINEQKKMALSARKNLFNSLNITKITETEYMALIDILLCKLAITDTEKRFSDVLENTWNETFEGVPYSDKVYSFIEKNEKPYMSAACFSIKNIKDGKVVRQLYKDAVILVAAIENTEKGNFKFGLREVNDVWKREGMKFANGYFFDDEFERMKDGLESPILLNNKNIVEEFHRVLLEKIETADFLSRNSGGKKYHSSEMEHVALNEKERQIDELQEKIVELEERVEITEKEVLSQFISLLDSKKYDHVLGKLYRIAYSNDEMKTEDIKRILKNLFEIMNISGIDIVGEIDTEANDVDLKKGKYRLDKEVSGKAEIRYPGYRVGNSVILHPLAEEV